MGETSSSARLALVVRRRMRNLLVAITLCLSSSLVVSVARADNKSKAKAPAPAKEKPKDSWMDGVTTYKVPGVDTAFKDPAEACKAEVALLAKSGNKKTFEGVKEGTSSTMMTCLLKESDGSPFEQSNIITKVLQCPETTSARSSDNSGEWASMRCHCNDKAGCPAKK